MATSEKQIGVGLIGLGGAAGAMITKFAKNPRFRVAACADIDSEIIERVKKDYPDAEMYTDAESLCQSKSVDLVYIATPNNWHTTHAQMALGSKKSVLIEKPMTIELDGAQAMVDLAKKNGVLLGVNVKHSFEPRVLKLRELARTGEFGQLRMINSWRFQDWLYRPRTKEELTPEPGGGILWRQGPHQFDIIRTIGGGLVRSLRGSANVWDPARRVPGSHAAYLDFNDGALATAVYSGYDHYDTREMVTGSGPQNPEKYGAARRELRDAPDGDWEERAARAERYGGDRNRGLEVVASGPSLGWVMGGPMLVSFDDADVRMSVGGLTVYGNDKISEIPLGVPGEDGRDGRLNSYYEALVNDKPLAADGSWGMATLEVLLAVDQSGKERKEMFLKHQTPTVDV
jgi:phthalate 4,5-cis-dihydrodiol dehydrogenase